MKILFAIASILLFAPAFSQDFPFGKISQVDLNMKKYVLDTSASAVVIKEFGDTRMSSAEHTPLIFEHHVRIKIFNSKEFKQGNIIIPIYQSNNSRFEEVSEITASTFFLNDNGDLQEAKLDPKKIFRENKNKYWDQVKFAMPNMRDGCIIEYSYKITSPYIFNFRSWTYQSDIPKMSSEYTVHIPAIYNYNAILKGALKLNGDPKMELEKESFRPGGGLNIDCSKITYSMIDIPAFIEEDHMTAIKNFISSVNFELSDYQDYNGHTHKITQDWKDIDNELKKSETFGIQIRKKNILKDLSIPAIAATDELSKAKAVYRFMQQWFKWNRFQGFNSENINKAVVSKTGSVADINLSLIATLSAMGLNTEAVLLSTRDNGIVNKLYPTLSDFNYVVAKVNIADKSYLLDASDPLLPFGLLPLRCINDQGRVMNFDKPSYWLDLKASQKLTKTHVLNLTLLETGKVKGSITTFSSGYEAYNKRMAIKKFSSVDEYVENLDESMSKIKILKSEIINIDNPDLILEEKYEVEINAYNNLDQERLLFNPVLLDRISENPFKLVERTYPVDIGSPSEKKITLILNFPEKFEVIDKPQEVNLSLPQNGGRVITSISSTENSITFSQGIMLNKSVYLTDEYPYLKELYNKIVQSQKSDIILKRK